MISCEELDKCEYNDIIDVLRSVLGVVIMGENVS